ncbi:MAG: hypothetical protein ABIJ39_08610 [Chloroflexota bacterium]
MSKNHLPEANRVSVLTAAVLLAFALTRVISTPDIDVLIPLPGIPLGFTINIHTAIAFLAAGLAATGMDWILRTHPSLEKGETHEHWPLPTLATLVVGQILNTLPNGITWWLAFGLSGVLLVAIFLAEFIVVDPGDARYPLASAALTALAFAIFLMLAIGLRVAEARLFLVIPALFLTSGLTALRTLHLRLNERWELGWAAGIALVVTQVGASLHAWPVSPVRYGLVLLGPIYALATLAVGLLEGNPFRRAVVEPVVMLSVIWGLAIWFR